MLKIGIIGSGIVAKTLATGFLKHGYKVMLGTRDASKLQEWSKENEGQIGTFASTAAFGDIIVLAVHGAGAKSALEHVQEKDLLGKTIIDTTNPIADTPPSNGVLSFFTNLDNSLMEQLQSAFPASNFVKSFSCVGNHLMVNPDFGASKPTMFICGNNASAKDEVKDILVKFGWDYEDMGAAEAARAIEPLCMLWCIPGITNNSWMHAFKLLKI